MSLDSILRNDNPTSITIPSNSKNLIQYPYIFSTKTRYGVTFTVQSDGGIKVEGTVNDSEVPQDFFLEYLYTPTMTTLNIKTNTTYTFSGFKSGSGVSLIYYNNSNNEISTAGQSVTFNSAITTSPLIAIKVIKGVTIDALLYPQLEEGTTATDYELNTGDKEVYKVSYGSRNLWQNTNTTFPSTLSYDSNTQTYTIGTGTVGYIFTVHKLDSPIPAGTVVTISAIFKSGKTASGVAFGGYHRTDTRSWQGYIDIPANTDLTGQTLTTTFTTTATVEEFLIFHNTGSNVEENIIFQVQYEIGNKATKYVPYSKEVVWKSTSYNLLPNPTSATQTITGITFTNNSDGTITVSGTATANSTYNLGYSIPVETNRQYILSGCPVGGSYSTFGMYYYDTVTSAYDFGDGVTFTPKGTTLTIYIRVFSGQTVDNLVFKPKLEYA